MRYTPRRGRILAAYLIAVATFAILVAPEAHHRLLTDITTITAALDYVLAVVHLRIAHNLARRTRGAKP